MNSKSESLLPHALLIHLLSYDPKTGVFRKRADGVEVGEIGVRGRVLITIDGLKGRPFPFQAHRLAWFYMHRSWPGGDIHHRDGNPANNAMSNLEHLSRADHLAKHGRTMRKRPIVVKRGVMARILMTLGCKLLLWPDDSYEIIDGSGRAISGRMDYRGVDAWIEEVQAYRCAGDIRIPTNMFSLGHRPPIGRGMRGVD